MAENNTEKLAVSPLEAAKMLGVGRTKIYQLVRINGFPAIHVGRRIIIPTDQLRLWLEQHADMLDD